MRFEVENIKLLEALESVQKKEHLKKVIYLFLSEEAVHFR